MGIINIIYLSNKLILLYYSSNGRSYVDLSAKVLAPMSLTEARISDG